MEREIDSIHLLIEHPIVLFVIGAIAIMVLLVAAAYFVGKLAERKENRREK